MKLRFWLTATLILLLILAELASIYFIMPFPGSQLMTEESDLGRVNVAYWLHRNLGWIRIAGLLALLVPVLRLLRKPAGPRSAERGPARPWQRYVVLALVILYGGAYYVVKTQLRADVVFLQPGRKQLATLSDNKIPLDKLVLGVEASGQATAYPIQLIGYHHQVRDTVGGSPVMVTYCTVCRTGRVFSPLVKGEATTFRLVGMDHNNAMFEDAATGTWWRQATGEAVVGPLEGEALTELPAQQMTLRAWAAEHPNTRVLQPDSAFSEEYDGMKRYERGLSKGKLTRRDSASWQPKSWVVGLERAGFAKAYDWNQLQKQRIISDVLGGEPLLLALASDDVSFAAVSRRVGARVLTFRYANRQLTDVETGSAWTWRGRCVAGPLRGQQLAPLPAVQEFWHSWRSFHPETAR